MAYLKNMGLLVNGVWKDRWYDTKKSGGKFIRSTYNKNVFKKFMLPNTPTFTLVSVKKDYVSLKTYNEKGKLIDTLRVDL